MFYANPTPVKKMHLNQFLKIEPPPGRQLVDFEQRMMRFEQMVVNNDLDFAAPEFNQDINLVAETLQNDTAPTLIERGVAALINLYSRDTETTEELDIKEEEVVEATDELDIFTKIKLLDLTKEFISSDNYALFSEPLLIKNTCAQKLALVGRLMGDSEQKATEIAKEIVRDMMIATNYPPVIYEKPDIPKIVELTKGLAQAFIGMKKND